MTNELQENDPRETARAFEDQAAGQQPGMLRELAVFLIENHKWWLAPIVIVLLLVGLLVVLAGTGAAPFIYTLF